MLYLMSKTLASIVRGCFAFFCFNSVCCTQSLFPRNSTSMQEETDNVVAVDHAALNDHVAQTAVLPLSDNDIFCNVATDSTVASHPPRCPCGCIPNILSLFEMAELRKQAKLKKTKGMWLNWANWMCHMWAKGMWPRWAKGMWPRWAKGWHYQFWHKSIKHCILFCVNTLLDNLLWSWRRASSVWVGCSSWNY